jgi:hypothetical protein
MCREKIGSASGMDGGSGGAVKKCTLPKLAIRVRTSADQPVPGAHIRTMVVSTTRGHTGVEGVFDVGVVNTGAAEAWAEKAFHYGPKSNGLVGKGKVTLSEGDQQKMIDIVLDPFDVTLTIPTGMGPHSGNVIIGAAPTSTRLPFALTLTGSGTASLEPDDSMGRRLRGRIRLETNPGEPVNLKVYAGSLLVIGPGAGSSHDFIIDSKETKFSAEIAGATDRAFIQLHCTVSELSDVDADKEEKAFSFGIPHAGPLIHFVWFGPGDPAASNTDGPLNIIRRIPGARVCFWCFERKMQAFSTALPGIAVRAIEMLAQEFDQGAQAALTFYEQARIYAPGKDVVAYMLMAARGGYFFDANCDLGDCSALLIDATSNRPWPAFISLQNPEQLSYVDINPADIEKDDFQALTMPVLLSYTKGMTEHKYNETDMWAMYAPPGGFPACRVLVENYVARARRAGMLTTPQLRTEGQRDFVADLTGGRRDQDGDAELSKGTIDVRKRTCAGALGTQSIYAAIFKLQQTAVDYDPATANFAAENTGNASYRITVLGLAKTHGGSW